MQIPFNAKSLMTIAVVSLAAAAAPGCSSREEASTAPHSTDALSSADRFPRYEKIRDSAHARGIGNAYLLAGIAMHESAGLAMCWSELTWACQGPNSPDCGGGPIMAGAGDGACEDQQGGLGMFQFDAGTYWDTINRYGEDVLTIDGQVAHAIDYVVNMVKVSAYTTDAETDDKARAWINRFDINNGSLRDQWIKTVLSEYNGCRSPDWSCWSPRYQQYNDALSQVLDETPAGFWGDVGITCDGGSGAVVGMIAEKYRALGGCGSVLGVPKSNELATPDGIGRYSVFDRGSIYWTEALGAHEVHGAIRDKWKDVGWEAGALGYPVTDETATPDSMGRYNVFERGSIYWTEATGAHEVRGAIRDKWKELGWEAGSLGYPISDEYSVAAGRKSDFQHGSITWNEKSNSTTVEMK